VTSGTPLVVCCDCGAPCDREEWNGGFTPNGCDNCGYGVGQVYAATDEIVGYDADAVADAETTNGN